MTKDKCPKCEQEMGKYEGCNIMTFCKNTNCEYCGIEKVKYAFRKEED